MKITPQGLGLWTAFYTHIDPCLMANDLVECGVKWLAIRSGQNGYDSHDWSVLGPGILKECKSRSIAVYTWHYGTPSHWQSEVAHVVKCLNAGASGHILDLEIEWQNVQNAGDLAVDYMQSLRAEIGDAFLAHAPFDFPSLHKGFPYVELGSYCDAVMPQEYWTEHHLSLRATIEKADHDWSMLKGPPIYPVGVTYGRGPYGQQLPALDLPDVNNFIAHYADRQAVSLYSYEAASSSVLDSLRSRVSAASA